MTNSHWVHRICVDIPNVLEIWLLGSGLTPRLILVMTKIGVTVISIEYLVQVGTMVVALVSMEKVLSIAAISGLNLILKRIGGLVGVEPNSTTSQEASINKAQ